ncbi:DUF2141 domain-containing protein [Echinicola rosea]|uniref:DUF2141 domain-containing protein n=1 Tax=Echinicola rosea TaxID=1807691 RepID=A0ABQ1V4U1_9BACT|nr:DUF2141 domain-containing protein [Echinicola rosea]GGF36655.1 hypothetical protein GCM10011339_26520 [Echinicola rosea]
MSLLYLILMYLVRPVPDEYSHAVITIDNVDLSLGGNIKIQVFDELTVVNSEGMAPILEKTITANVEDLPVRLDQLPIGEYMIAVLHDSNGNGKLDYSIFGVPKEGYAFSGQFSCSLKSAGPKLHMIHLTEGLQHIRMHLCY